MTNDLEAIRRAFHGERNVVIALCDEIEELRAAVVDLAAQLKEARLHLSGKELQS